MKRRLVAAFLTIGIVLASITSIGQASYKNISSVLHWHRTTITTTAYVVNRAERFKCDVYWRHKTASGTIPAIGTAAVDPSVFPFGTQFIIPGYGRAIARDTGGAVRGTIVDLVLPTCASAFEWGRRRLSVSVALPSDRHHVQDRSPAVPAAPWRRRRHRER